MLRCVLLDMPVNCMAIFTAAAELAWHHDAIRPLGTQTSAFLGGPQKKRAPTCLATVWCLKHLQETGACEACAVLSFVFACRVLFVVAKPREPSLFQAMQEEAAALGDVAVLPGIWEAYHNITHQTLEILRLAAVMPAVTHVAKVSPFVSCISPDLMT